MNTAEQVDLAIKAVSTIKDNYKKETVSIEELMALISNYVTKGNGIGPKPSIVEIKKTELAKMNLKIKELELEIIHLELTKNYANK